MNYSITWAYIVSRMESLFGIKPNCNEEMSFRELIKYQTVIFDEYYDLFKMAEGHKLSNVTEYPR